MNETHTKKEKILLLVKIVFPILVTQVAMYLVTFFDIYMTSRYGTEDLAGVSIGSSFWVPVYIGLAGILMSITPIVAQLMGAKKKEQVKQAVQQGIYLSLLLATIVFAFFYFGIDSLLTLMNLEPAVADVASRYIQAMSIGLIPLFIYTTLRSYIDALGATRVTMVISLLSTPINILFNYLLIFGKFGFPELGGVGAGLASAITYWLILAIAAWIIHTRNPFSVYGIFRKWPKLSLSRWIEISRIGVPIGISIFVETSIFSAVTFMLAAYGTYTIAAHQIALNFTSLLYMLPLSISMGATILVGYEVGAKRFRDARQYSWLSVVTAVSFSFVSACILYFMRVEIAALYTSDPVVVELAVQFLLFAALFQLSDAIQAPVQGALRGYKDVNITFVMAVISYWIIGLPCGYLLANYTDFGAFGYWIGLIIGLTAGAITLSIRLLSIQKKIARHTTT
ncbi:Multi antimicrobial extrusion protein (Na(+)/drug antiporter), MATE family of MDR efflux pump [Planococcus halocryophilus Or1]|uniref:Probable multidrug resistance protein NorM n=1 Tax=Planococcus halocryophilus TaxID=1215089 RepID=A0A1C7DNN3_9BACL|nr:MATE family efflux transporter [Planococcus halocryophilus]ANU13210.1 MATE family efflux transporter [Planococcus halocryophilus]EMF46879.1 Multi antimicrobial extrusion protein (Na(+)/drug antiporter), MATE family of MDR efflux pump [Planococcus halocryophilus Or1]